MCELDLIHAGAQEGMEGRGGGGQMQIYHQVHPARLQRHFREMQDAGARPGLLSHGVNHVQPSPSTQMLELCSVEDPRVNGMGC